MSVVIVAAAGVGELIMTIGATIRAFRLRRGWSLADLAARIGAAERTVDQWERDYRRPPRWRLAKLIALGFVPPPRQQPCVMRRAA